MEEEIKELMEVVEVLIIDIEKLKEEIANIKYELKII